MGVLPPVLVDPTMAGMSTQEHPGRAMFARAHGDAAWARAQIEAGAKVRKTVWPAGPWIARGSAPGTFRVDGIDGADPNQDFGSAQIFREDEEGDTWELHPPRSAVPTLYAPASWILFLFPRLGGREAFDAVVEALSKGTDFAELLLDQWRAAGREETGKSLLAKLAALDRGLFHRSLAGDVAASTEILQALMSKTASETPR